MRSRFLRKLLDYLKQHNHFYKNTDINMENIPNDFMKLTPNEGEHMSHILFATIDTPLT